jgi:hypothetical protein
MNATHDSKPVAGPTNADLAAEIDRLIKASLNITPEALALLQAVQREALANPKLASGTGGCINGTPHAWREVRRYKMWSGSVIDTCPPDGCSWTVEESCLICGESRQILVPDLPNTEVSGGNQ